MCHLSMHMGRASRAWARGLYSSGAARQAAVVLALQVVFGMVY